MTTLTSRLNKIVEFDSSRVAREWNQLIIDGMNRENTRLQPILKALIECVVALEQMILSARDNNCGLRMADEALTSLEQAIQKQEME